jgi:hypothetical protein
VGSGVTRLLIVGERRITPIRPSGQLPDPDVCNARLGAPLTSHIATCQQNRPTESRQTRDKTVRPQIEKPARQLSWAPPLFALFVLRYRRICKVAGEGKSIPFVWRRIDLKQYCNAKSASDIALVIPHRDGQAGRLYLSVVNGWRPLLLLQPATNTSRRMPYFGCRMELTQINAFEVQLHMIFFLRTNGGVEIT